MSAWPEVAVDHAMRREEPLRLGRRFETLHLPLSSSRWSMRVFRTVVQVSARSVPDIRQQSAMCDCCAAIRTRTRVNQDKNGDGVPS
jgi:hypothetical protein